MTNGKRSKRKKRLRMSKKTIFNLTYLACFLLVSIGSINFIDDGINQITLKLKDEDFSILNLIRAVFMLSGIHGFSKFMMRFGK